MIGSTLSPRSAIALFIHWLELYSGPRPGAAGAAVYVVAPKAAHWDELAGKLGLPEQELRGWPLKREFDYYRVYRSPKH